MTTEAVGPITDYSDVIERLEANLLELAVHIREHNMIADAEIVATQIEVAVRMLVHARAFDGPDLPGAGAPEDVMQAWADAYAAQEQVAWDDAWNYIRDHAQKWWD